MRLQVGRIDKAHGIRGDVLVTLLTNRIERVDPGSVLFSDDDRAFTVIESRPHQHRYIVLFKGYATRNEAEALRGTDLWADPIDDPEELWVHELVGAQVVDLEGAVLGTIDAVESNPASDLLLLDNDGIVPLTFFIEQLSDGTIVVDPPVGLLDDAGDADDADDAAEASDDAVAKSADGAKSADEAKSADSSDSPD